MYPDARSDDAQSVDRSKFKLGDVEVDTLRAQSQEMKIDFSECKLFTVAEGGQAPPGDAQLVCTVRFKNSNFEKSIVSIAKKIFKCNASIRWKAGQNMFYELPLIRKHLDQYDSLQKIARLAHICVTLDKWNSRHNTNTLLLTSHDFYRRFALVVKQQEEFKYVCGITSQEADVSRSAYRVRLKNGKPSDTGTCFSLKRGVHLNPKNGATLRPLGKPQKYILKRDLQKNIDFFF